MTDIFDQAQERAQVLLDHAIANRKTFDQSSNRYCDGCGDDIPAKRRALGGVTHCFECQSHIERNAQHITG